MKKMMTISMCSRRLCGSLLILGLLMLPGAVPMAATGDMSQSTLLLASPVPPNVMLVIDNSGSMAWNTLTSYDTSSEYDGTGATRAYYSSDYNKIYYNPNVRYLPANDADDKARASASITGAWFDPFLSVGTGSGQRDNTSNKIDLSATCGTLYNATHGNYSTYQNSSVTEEFSLPLYNTTTYAAKDSSYCYTNTSDVTVNAGTTKKPNYVTFSLNNTYARYAFYYVWDKTTNIATKTPANSAFTRVDILAKNAPFTRTSARDDCTTVNDTTRSCSLAQEQANFANWFSYYRTRLLTVKTGTSLAFSSLDKNYRVGYGEINANLGGVDNGDPGTTIIKGVRAFTGTNKSNWFDALYACSTTGSTPLRRAMDDVGRYYARTDSKGPWGANPGSGSEAISTHVPCRKSFLLMMTDGYWNYGGGSSSDFPSEPTSADNTAESSVITGTDGNTTVYYKYDPAHNQPADVATMNSKCTSSGCASCTVDGTTCFASSYFSSSQTKTLADVAMYYWKRDLRTDLANKVPRSDEDPAFWQHMTTFTVGLGVKGSIDYNSTNIAALKTGNSSVASWPNISEDSMKDSAYAVDDLWHAAVNGHGSFYSAADPVTFREGLLDALNKISKVSGVAASEAVSSTNVSAGDYLFEPSFKSSDWEGHLKAYPWSTAANDFSTTASWDAATVLPAYGSRNIVTMIGGAQKDFIWTNFSSEQQSNYFSNKQEIFNYLRGDGTNEVSDSNLSGKYRERKNTKLGDIVNSSPLYVKKGNAAGYGSLATIGASYITYLNSATSDRNTRPGVVYVGANDGMLHAFRADTGVEVFAFIPESIHANLLELTKRTYSRSHKFFVDGHLTSGDAYLSSAWKTILVGAAGAGAKSVFAIDITNPGTTFSGLTKDSVLWEQSAVSDDYMGYVLGDVQVARMASGDWVAIHGNGYASKNNHAVLYIRNLSDGKVLAKIDTGVGSSTAQNGLSAPVLVRNRNYEVIQAYAGDMQGNLWKFDLSGTTSSSWKVALGTTPLPLYTAASDATTSTVQPIIQKPMVKEHTQGGYMVIFGTGKFFQEGDESNTDVQSIYGIWDKPGITATITRSQLKKETWITTTGGYKIDPTSLDCTKMGWYVNMINTGERAVADPLLVDDIAYVKTLKPGGDTCSAGGDSYLYRLDYMGCKNVVDTPMTAYVSGSTGGFVFYRTPTGTSIVSTPSFTPGTGPQQTQQPPLTSAYRNWRRLPAPIPYSTNY